MNISISELNIYIEHGYEIEFSYLGQQYAIVHTETEEELLSFDKMEDHQWRKLHQATTFDELCSMISIESSPFEIIWPKATDISIEKISLITLIRTLQFGELEFRVHHKRYFAEGASGGYYCISLDEIDENGDTMCHSFEAKPSAKSFDMFMNARLFDGMTFKEAYNEMTIIKGVFFEE
ncbi:MAG: hypothetical protein IJ165_05505 [Proteobacteria bacterium]|nr:hypothetical protein [Pseudomonadota bacterium]